MQCFIQLSGTERDNLISRYHCQLDIDPPGVRVQDLGSRNGTFVNGRPVDLRREEMAASEIPGSDLTDGDLLTVGGTTLRVDTIDCPHATCETDKETTWEAGVKAKRDCLLRC
jgi:hypothetical protein